MNNPKNKKVLKAGMWYILGNIITKGINFITVPIFSRLLDQNEFGMYNNYISWSIIIGTIVSLQLESTILRAKYEFKENFSSYRWSIILLSIVTIVISMGITIWLYPYFYNFLSMETIYVILMYIGILSTAIIGIYQTCQIIEYNYKNSVILSIILAVANIVFSLILMYFFEDKLFGRILGAELSTWIIGLGVFSRFLQKTNKFNIQYCKYALKISIPYIPHLLSLNILNSMDKIMITYYCGAKSTALYSAAYTCGLAIRVVTSSINTAFSPWLGERIHLKQYKDVYNISIKYVLFGGYFVIGVMLFAPELSYIIGGQLYINAGMVIIPVAIGCFCQFIYTMYVNIEQFEKKTIPMAIATIFAAVINLITNMIFIPEYGYIAAAYTTLFSYFILTCIHYLLVCRLKLNMLYNNMAIFIIIGIISVVGILISDILSKYFLRYFLISIYIIWGSYVFIRARKATI